MDKILDLEVSDLELTVQPFSECLLLNLDPAAFKNGHCWSSVRPGSPPHAIIYNGLVVHSIVRIKTSCRRLLVQKGGVQFVS